MHAASVEEASLPAESPLTQDLELALWPYDPLEGPADPRTGTRLRLVPGRRAAMELAAARVRGTLAADAAGAAEAG